MKALIGMTAGATGAFVGTPAEVALIRMTADGSVTLSRSEQARIESFTMAAATGNKPKTSPKAVKFLFGGLAG
ncbi:Mitochondrial 2-oxoglutarate/malate carrier protein [Acipenser ruthenus]|uniref:Mitochondrial 2-oxoglutarate/malate carrier protein n=1 Tax=Acipenser ruthenus TaxID=7906 RepID=A0A444UUI9_ACIRT|nr:Mitochondrial 2-oxoglutarate/malate carrier protein [Acipenser ruthenus]